MEDVLRIAGRRLHIQPRALPFVDLNDPAANPRVFSVAMDFALLPRSSRLLHATALNSDTET